MSALNEEVSALRAAPPQFLLRVGGPTPAPLLCDAQGELHFPTEEEGPWDIEVVLTGKERDPVMAAPLRARLRFGATWPLSPPLIRVGGQLSFGMVGRDRSPPALFYERLFQTEDGVLRLPEVIKELRIFLLDPLTSLGFDEEGADEASASRARNWCIDVKRLNEQRTDVARRYVPLAKHTELFEPLPSVRDEWLAPEFRAARDVGSSEAWAAALVEHIPGEVYSFPLFTEKCCDAFVGEVFNFDSTGLPAKRPNSMNKYGLILNEIGLEPLVSQLQAQLQPIGRAIFPGVGSAWDDHHCFTVRYKEGEDLGLDMHTDDSDVTFNVCLGLDFEGAGLQFCGFMGSPSHRQHSATYFHAKGWCVVHRGRRRHGADDILAGERLNLILWNHSSEYRRSTEYRQPVYLRESGPPALQCLSHTHDRDFATFLPLPASSTEASRSRAWCPPSMAEYPGFKQVPREGAQVGEPVP